MKLGRSWTFDFLKASVGFSDPLILSVSAGHRHVLDQGVGPSSKRSSPLFGRSDGQESRHVETEILHWKADSHGTGSELTFQILWLLFWYSVWVMG